MRELIREGNGKKKKIRVNRHLSELVNIEAVH